MTDQKRFLLLDRAPNWLFPLTRFRSSFTQRTGIFSARERLNLSSEVSVIFASMDPDYEKLIAESENMTPLRSIEGEDFREYDPAYLTKIYNVLDSRDDNPMDVLEDMENRIVHDLPLLLGSDSRFIQGLDHPSLSKVSVVGKVNSVYINETATLLPGSVIDTRNGPVIIDADTEISPFSYLEGPLYIGKGCRIDDARITGGCIIGHSVRIGGEVENSIFNDYSNKHHEGFIGHSIVGSWVNLGALTTTSDLKNNYGEIRLKYPSSLKYTDDEPLWNNLHLEEYNTGLIKFGSIIGDGVKTAIGTMINTGTVIDAGANIFGSSPEKYVHPFQWGAPGALYDRNRFLSDITLIMGRRKQKPSSSFSELVDLLYKGGHSR